MGKKKKANIFENFICQQVSMGKKTADKQRSSRLARSDKKLGQDTNIQRFFKGI